MDRTSFLSCLLVFSTLSCIIASVHAQTGTTTVYISPSGSDFLNNGLSAARPFQTLARAATLQTLSSPNLIINCANGSYPSTSTVSFSTGNITLQLTTPSSSPDEYPVIFDISTSSALIRLTSVGVLTLNPGLSIAGSGLEGSNGGLLSVIGSVVANGVVFSAGSVTGVGGAININSEGAGPNSFTRCTFGGNAAASGGAVALTNGDASFVDCKFVSNTAQTGGAVSVTNTNTQGSYVVSFTNTLFQGNLLTSADTTTAYGGALSVDQPGQQLVLTSCQFVNNPAAVAVGSGVVFTATGSSFNQSAAYAVQTTSNQLTLTDCSFVGNDNALVATGTAGATDSTSITGCSFTGSSENGIVLQGLQSQAVLSDVQSADPVLVSDSTFAAQASSFSKNGRFNLTLPSSSAVGAVPSSFTGCSFTTFFNMITLTSVDPSSDSLASLSIANCSFSVINSDNTWPVISVTDAWVAISASSFDVNSATLLYLAGSGTSSFEGSTFGSSTDIEVTGTAALTFSYTGQFAQVSFSVEQSGHLTYYGRNASSIASLLVEDNASASLGLLAVTPNAQNTLFIGYLVLDGLVTLTCLSNDTAYVTRTLLWKGGVIQGSSTTVTVQIPAGGVATLTNDWPKALVWNSLTNYGEFSWRHYEGNSTAAIDLVPAPGAITNFNNMDFQGTVSIMGGYCSFWNDGVVDIAASAGTQILFGSQTEFTMTRRAKLNYRGPWQAVPFLLSFGQVSVNGTLTLSISSDSKSRESLVAWSAIEFNSSSCTAGAPCKFQTAWGNLLRSNSEVATFRPAITYSAGAITIVESDVKKVGLGGGAIAGIVIGSIAGAVLLAGLSYFAYTKYYKPKHADSEGLYQAINEPIAW